MNIVPKMSGERVEGRVSVWASSDSFYALGLDTHVEMNARAFHVQKSAELIRRERVDVQQAFDFVCVGTNGARLDRTSHALSEPHRGEHSDHRGGKRSSGRQEFHSCTYCLSNL